jgi:Pyruvate/2-oxoacid:ferredoxin oxidoreductase gamma subunit
VPEELIGFLLGKRRVLVVEEGMPNYIERELKALAHEARLPVEIAGKDVLSPAGEYVPAVVLGGLRRFLTGAGLRSVSATTIEERYQALTGHQAKLRQVLPQPVSKRPPSFCTGCPERPVLELFADDGHSPAPTPVFSLYPVPGDLDVLLAPELLEVGRAIELGFPSPARTTIIASSHRLYSIHEKVVTGRGIYPVEDLLTAARAFSRALIAFDALALAREHGTEANAVLLGALAASNVLPVSEAAYRKAIEAKGVQVAANLKGFEVGLALAKAVILANSPPRGVAAPSPGDTVAPPAGFAGEVAALPENLQSVVGAALSRLIDYQDTNYARRYLAQLARFVDGRPRACAPRRAPAGGVDDL